MPSSRILHSVPVFSIPFSHLHPSFSWQPHMEKQHNSGSLNTHQFLQKPTTSDPWLPHSSTARILSFWSAFHYTYVPLPSTNLPPSLFFGFLGEGSCFMYHGPNTWLRVWLLNVNLVYEKWQFAKCELGELMSVPSCERDKCWQAREKIEPGVTGDLSTQHTFTHVAIIAQDSYLQMRQAEAWLWN